MSVGDLLSQNPERYTPAAIERRRRDATAPERELARRLRAYAQAIMQEADELLGPGHPDRNAFMRRLSRLVGQPGLLDAAHVLDGGPREIVTAPAASGRPAEAGPADCSTGPVSNSEEEP